MFTFGTSLKVTWCRFLLLLAFVLANVLVVFYRTSLLESWTAVTETSSLSPVVSANGTSTENRTSIKYVTSSRNGTVTQHQPPGVDQDFDPDLFPRNVCKGREIKLIICVPVARKNAEGRQVIRNTWGSFGLGAEGEANKMALVFFIGEGVPGENSSTDQKLQEEYSKFGDLVKGPYVDTYENLTHKSLSILRFVSRYCSESRFLVKTDDDMYVNIPLLLQALEEKQRKMKNTSFIMGFGINGAKPIRNPKSKWYSPVKSFASAAYPSYVSGTTYSMTTSAALPLLQASSRVPFFWLEDIFITGVCSKEAKIRVVNDNRFTYDKPPASGIRWKSQISGHRYSWKEIKKIHAELFSQKR